MASGDSVLTKSFLCQWFNLEVLKEFLVECVLVRTKIEKKTVLKCTMLHIISFKKVRHRVHESLFSFNIKKNQQQIRT